MKLILVSIVILSAVVLFLFALFPADISVTRVVQTSIPKDSLYARVSDLRRWPRWNVLSGATEAPAAAADARLDYPQLVVMRLRKNPDSVVVEWKNARGKSFTGSFYFAGDGVQTILEWKLQFHLRWYPWEKLSGMLYEKELGARMDSSLLNLTQSRPLP